MLHTVPFMLTGNKLLVDNDLQHRPQSRTGFVALQAGFHPIRVEYFESNDTNVLIVRMSGPELKEQIIGAEYLWHLDLKIREGEK